MGKRGSENRKEGRETGQVLYSNISGSRDPRKNSAWDVASPGSWTTYIFSDTFCKRGGHIEKKWHGPDFLYFIPWVVFNTKNYNQPTILWSRTCNQLYPTFKRLTFTSHHWPRLKSLLTGAFKTSNHILAGSISTRIAYWTFISVCKWSETNSKYELRKWTWTQIVPFRIPLEYFDL